MERNRPLLSSRLELALQRATYWHRNQSRKGTDLPYILHPMAVGMILDRLGYDEDVVIAGLLHDAVEDTEATLDAIEREFGEPVAALVSHCSEVKTDATGRKRPWVDRKRDHLDALQHAPESAKAVVLADKLHNLLSIRADLESGVAIWGRFNAGRDAVLASYEATLRRLGVDSDDERLRTLAEQGLEALEAIRRFEPPVATS